MPIKFRCQQCRQFLGISRSQAESVVDCPTCGRTIRVPALDGTVRPLPKPGLDPQDSKLAAALDELASIGEIDGQGSSPEDPEQEVTAPAVPEEENKPSPLLREYVVIGPDGKPVDLDVFPERCDIEPVKLSEQPGPDAAASLAETPEPDAGTPGLEVPQSEPADSESLHRESSRQNRPWAETAQPGDSWKKLLAAADGQSDAGLALAGVRVPDSPGKVAAARLSGKPKTHGDQPQRPGGLSPGMWIVLVGVAAVLFAAGFWGGRVTTVPGQSDAVPPPRSRHSTESHAQTGNGETSAATAGSLSEPGKVALRGRITYQLEGQRKPDQGARVIVLPGDWTGQVKLPAGGFRSDQAVDRRVATASLQAIGGNLTLTDEQGQFEITLPSSGRFIVLVLSNALDRGDAAVGTDVEHVLAKYFDRPAQLLGRLRCYAEEVRWNGTVPEPWDYSFPD